MERSAPIGSRFRAVGPLLRGLRDRALDAGLVELRPAPDFFRGLHAELVFVERERLQVLSAEELALFFETEQLGHVVEVLVQHRVAELAVAAGEQLVLMPDLVDDLRRRDVVVAHDAEVHELLVLTDGQESEFLRPAMFLGDLGGERPCEGVFVAEGAFDALDKRRRHEVRKAVLPQTNPEVSLHVVLLCYCNGLIPIYIIT